MNIVCVAGENERGYRYAKKKCSISLALNVRKARAMLYAPRRTGGNAMSPRNSP